MSLALVPSIHGTQRDGDSHSRILNFWQPPTPDLDDLDDAEAAMAEMEERLSAAARERMWAAPEYVPFLLTREAMFGKDGRAALEHILDFDILAARLHSGRGPFELPSPPGDLIEESDALVNLNLACVLGLAVCDGLGDPWSVPNPDDDRLPVVAPHRLPTDRVRSVELGRILGVDSHKLATALRRVGVIQRGMRFPDAAPHLPAGTKGYRRADFRKALSWLVRL